MNRKKIKQEMRILTNLNKTIMRKQKYFMVALATIAMAGCTNDLITETDSKPAENAEAPIVFGSLSKGMTRADFQGKDAADKLGSKFVVSAKKGNLTAATNGTITFDNYVVEYAENTAHTTESNSTNWEYVGKGRIKHAIDHGITSQTIKYWDYSQAQYDFIAWSAGSKTAIYEGDPSDGEVLVSSINPNATATAAVTFTGKAADLSQVYISDLTTVKKADYGTDPVMMKFRSLGTKVRIGIYETIPGYSVKNVQFYGAAASDDASATTARLFTTVANNIYTEGTYTVKYDNVDGTSADNNQAHVIFTPKAATEQATTISMGGLNYTIAEEGEKTSGSVFLGRTSATASFAGEEDDNYYTAYLPNESGTNLNLRVNFTLEAIDGGGETIEVKGATAQVPSIYTTWQPGFAYTYIFKISDKTNGHTGVYDPTKPDDTTVNSDPAGLYPITFDAVVVNAEDNDKTQETITLVATPSITTYQKGSNVVNNNEYLASTGKIYVTVNDGGGYVEVTGLTVGDDVSNYYTYNPSTGKYTKCGASDTAADGTKYYRLDPVLANGALQTLTGKVALYTIPNGKTEAEVVDALQMQDDDAASGTIKGRSGLVLTEASYTLDNKVEYGVDNNTINVSTDQAMFFTPTAATTYAFVYTKTAATPANNKDMYQAWNWSSFAAGQTKYRYDYKDPTTADAQKGVKYFKEDAGVYTMQTAFIGQGVSNLYLDGSGNTIASGYAATGTTYYYTTDKGMTYKAAANIAYEAFESATDLYTFDGSDYTAKSDATPVNGRAYYKRTGTNTPGDPYVYTYCVILPQQTTGWKELDTTTYVVANEAAEVVGQTYFDKYTQNNGVYYTKVIKVQ